MKEDRQRGRPCKILCWADVSLGHFAGRFVQRRCKKLCRADGREGDCIFMEMVNLN